MAWWKRTERTLNSSDKKSVPKGVWTKCKGCQEIVVETEIAENLGVCPRCDFHYPLGVGQRLALLVDEGSFEPIAEDLRPEDPLSFRDTKRYKDRLRGAQKKSGLNEAALAGMATIDGRRVGIGLLAFEFMGGSMGSVVGEMLTRVLEQALDEKCPAIISSASGGARMQEGILSLMQMAKTTAALQRLKRVGLPYISLLHHPTTGGVAASFSMLGDLIIAEPKALIGFAGPRVIQQTIGEKLPEGFQRSEFLLEHGMIDMIVARPELRQRLSFLLRALTANQPR
jgi:acetyl-CoA carboxylase carboxyl transferase subunit beta